MADKNKTRKLVTGSGIVFFISLLSLLLGFSIAEYKFKPYAFLSGAYFAGESLGDYIELEFLSSESAHRIAVPFQAGGVLRNVKGKVQPGATFYTFFADDEYQAALIDDTGKKIHQWRIPYQEAGLLQPRSEFGLSKHHLFAHGAYLYPNGDILVSFEFRGLMKLDKDSKLLWKLDKSSHHAIDVAEDGTIWTLNRQLGTDKELRQTFSNNYYYDDQVMQLNSNGELLASYSILDILRDSGYMGLLLGHTNQYELSNTDSLHVNDVEVLTPEEAASIPGASAGNVMVSMRAISTLMVLDLEAHSVVWSMTGPFVRQHDPEFDSNGKLWVFDNRNAYPQLNGGVRYQPQGQQLGSSQVLEINAADQRLLWKFQGSEAEPFFSSIMGRIQPLPNGNVLVVEPEGGRIFEVSVPAGEIVWEYRNLLEPGVVGRISDADRYATDKLTFIN